MSFVQNVIKKLATKRRCKMAAQKTEKKQERTKCEVYSRIVGYLRPVSQWNPGKEAEFYKRKTYKVS